MTFSLYHRNSFDIASRLGSALDCREDGISTVKWSERKNFKNLQFFEVGGDKVFKILKALYSNVLKM